LVPCKLFSSRRLGFGPGQGSIVFEDHGPLFDQIFPPSQIFED
jgi:hypothetical protein